MALQDNCPLSARVDKSFLCVCVQYRLVRQTTFPKKSSCNLHAYVVIAVINLNNLYFSMLQLPN